MLARARSAKSVTSRLRSGERFGHEEPRRCTKASTRCYLCGTVRHGTALKRMPGQHLCAPCSLVSGRTTDCDRGDRRLASALHRTISCIPPFPIVMLEDTRACLGISCVHATSFEQTNGKARPACTRRAAPPAPLTSCYYKCSQLPNAAVVMSAWGSDRNQARIEGVTDLPDVHPVGEGSIRPSPRPLDLSHGRGLLCVADEWSRLTAPLHLASRQTDTSRWGIFPTF